MLPLNSWITLFITSLGFFFLKKAKLWNFFSVSVQRGILLNINCLKWIGSLLMQQEGMVSTSTIVTCISHIIWSVCDILTSAQLLVSWWLVKCKSRLLLMNEWHILLRVPCISHWNCWFELWSCKCLHLVNGKWGGKLFQRKAIVHNTTCCSSKDLREVHKVSQYDPYKFFRGRQKKDAF